MGKIVPGDATLAARWVSIAGRNHGNANGHAMWRNICGDAILAAAVSDRQRFRSGLKSGDTCRGMFAEEVVMLGPVQPTEYDLQFSLLGIPVRVIPTFWLLAALLGWGYIHWGLIYVVVWVLVVFVSILAHELGHALTAASFGYPPRIFLYHFGGVAMFAPHGDFTAGKSILITLAGPGVGLLLGGCVLLTDRVLSQREMAMSPLALQAIEMLLFVNIGWSLLNLLPVLPLDGGQICRDVCTSLSPRRGELWAIRIALAVSGLVALAAFSMQQIYLGVMFGLMCYQNFQQLQHRRVW